MRKNSLDYKTILNYYLAMPKHTRSIRKLHSELLHKYEQMINNKSISIPHLNTLWNWSSKNNWLDLAKQHDLKVSEKLNKRIINNEVNKQEKILSDLQDTSYLALQKVTAALKSNVMKEIDTPQDIKALVNSVTDAMKMFNIMTGGITSRSESITHNVASPDEIKKQIMILMTSLASDGIEIEPLDKEDKEKLN